MSSFRIRAGKPDDLPWIRALLDRAPEAASWLPEDHLWLVAEPESGFICWRAVAENEFELLNLVVAPEFRRQKLGSALLDAAGIARGAWFLEVRASNQAAQEFYRQAGFAVMGNRKKYYEHPVEDAIVLGRKEC